MAVLAQLPVHEIEDLGHLQLTLLLGMPKKLHANAAGGVILIELLSTTHHVPGHFVAEAVAHFCQGELQDAPPSVPVVFASPLVVGVEIRVPQQAHILQDALRIRQAAALQ
jgi:hypothetical protein